MEIAAPYSNGHACTLKSKPRPHWLVFALITAILLVIGFFVTWNNGLRDRVIAKNFGIVEQGKIYRSGQISSAMIERTLRENGIRKIVALSATGGKQPDIEAEVKVSHTLHIDRELFPLSGDGTGKVSNYAAAVAAIDKAVKEGQPVLVHCVAGAQRTGGVLAVYMLLVEKRSPGDVYRQMHDYGHDPHDNPHLLEYLNKNLPEIADDLVKLGVLDKVPDPIPNLAAN